MSHVLKKGARDVEAKAKSRTAGLPVPVRGKQVYTRVVLSMLYHGSAAREKYGKEAHNSV